MSEKRELTIHDLVLPGNENELISWLNDSSHIEEVQNVFNESQTQTQVTLLALRYLQNYVYEFFDFWDQKDQVDFLNWFESVLFNQNDRFISENALFELSSSFFGNVITHSFSFSEQVEQLIDSFLDCFDGNHPNRLFILNILSNICESNNIVRRKDIFDKYYLKFLELAKNYMVMCVKDCLYESTELSKSLLLAFNSMQYSVSSMSDNNRAVSTNGYIDFPNEWSAIILDSAFSNSLFDILSNSNNDNASIVYKLLNTLFSLNRSMFDSNESEKEYFLSLYEKFISSIVISDKTLYGMCKCLFRTKKVLDERVEQSKNPEEKFSEMVLDISGKIIIPSNIFDHIYSIMFLISYWNTLKTYPVHSNSDPLNIKYISMHQTVFDLYIKANLGAVEMGAEEYITQFLNIEENYNNQYKPIQDLCSKWFSEGFNVIIELLNGHLCTFFDCIEKCSDTTVSETKIGFLVNLSLGICQGLRLNTSDSAILSSLCRLFYTTIGVFDQILGVIPELANQGTNFKHVLENIFNNFSRSISQYEFLIAGVMSEKFFSIIKENSESQTLVSSSSVFYYLFKTLIGFIREYPNNKLIVYQSIVSISKLLNPNREYSRIVSRLDIGSNIVELRLSNEFIFLKDIAQGRSRALFHSALCSILTSPSVEKSVLSRFFDVYDGVLEYFMNENEIWGVFQDFIGYFSSNMTTDQFMIFFNYLFPKRLTQLIKCLPQLTSSQILIVSFIKMLNTMIGKDPQRIVFSHHSANGVILFHQIKDFITSVIDLLYETLHQNIGDKLALQIVYRLLQIITSAVNAKYVPFNAFRIYNDPSLRTIIQGFARIMSLQSVNYFFQFPKIESTLINFLYIMSANHCDLLFETNENVSSIVLPIISLSIKSDNTTSIKKGIDTMNKITENVADITILNHEDFVRIVFQLFSILYQSRSSARMDVCICIKNIIHRYPDILDILYSRISEQIVDKESLASSIQSLTNKFEEYAASGTTQDYVRSIETFIIETKPLMNNPVKVFFS